MNKTAVLIAITLLISVFSAYAEDVYTAGSRQDALILKKIKNLSVVLEYEHTLLGETNIYEFFEVLNKKAGSQIYDIEYLIKSMLKQFETAVADEKKWDFKIHKNKSDIKEGYVLYIVIDKIGIAYNFGYRSNFTVTCYNQNDQKILFTVKLSESKIGSGDYETAVKIAGKLTGEKLISFLKSL